MQQLISKEWGYKILTPTSFNFYHSLLGKIGVNKIGRVLTDFKEIEILKDGSLNVSTESINKSIQELENFIKQNKLNLTSTPQYTYKIKKAYKSFLNEWLISLEGCIGLILLNTCFNVSPYSKEWELINSSAGGLFINPYTILFYDDHAKVIHPIRIDNLGLRERIEKETAISITGMMERIEEAQPGYEGLAMISYVEYKTGLSQKEIVDIINEKSFQIKAPKSSPLFKN